MIKDSVPPHPAAARPTSPQRGEVFAALIDSGYAGLGALIVIVLLAPLGFDNNYHYDVAMKMGLNAIVAVGLNLLVGYAGQISLGHAAFFAIGGYSSAILASRYSVHGLIALPVGAALAGALAFLVARPILRLSGHYLAMATLGLGIIVSIVINREIEFTGGPDGISVPVLQIFAWKLRGPQTWYWIVAAVLVIVIFLSLNLMRSAFGRGLRALADSEIAALSGSLFANAERFITPDEAGFLRSVELVTMVVVGGMASTFGAAVGAALLTLLPQALSGFELWHDFLFGAILVTAMIFLPKGIVPSLHLRLIERRRAAKPDLPALP